MKSTFNFLIITFISLIFLISQFTTIHAKDELINKSNIVWEKVEGLDEFSVYGIAYNGQDLYVALASTGYGKYFILTSKDARKWEISKTLTKSYFKIIWGNNEFIALDSKGSVLISKTGEFWNEVPLGTVWSTMDIVWNGKIYVIVGGNATILTSEDGLVWKNNSYYNGYQMGNIIWDGHRFIALGARNNLQSEDGANWINYYGGPYDTYCETAFNGENYITLGAGYNTIQSSNNSIDWKTTYSEENFQAKSILWDGTQYVVICVNSNYILTSPDGANWIKSDFDKNPHELVDIIWTGKHYIAFGYSGAVFIGTKGTPTSTPVPRRLNSTIELDFKY